MPTASGSRLPFARSTHAGGSTLSTVSTGAGVAACAEDAIATAASSAQATAYKKLRIIVNPLSGDTGVTGD